MWLNGSMSTRYDARRAYQRTALDRHSATAVSLVVVLIVLGALVLGAVRIKSEADAFVDNFNSGTTGQRLSAAG